MFSRLLTISLLMLLVAVPVGSQAANVKVIALFTDKALLQVDGEQKIVKKGEIFKGVLLKSSSGRGAVVEIDGKTSRLDLNQSIAGNFKKPDRTRMKIYPNSLGMYVVKGKINGQTTRFLVDTGATFVTLSGDKAAKLKIDLSDAARTTAQTAASIVNVYQIQLNSVSIGGIQMREVEAMVIPGNQPFEVLLGNSFLRYTKMKKAGSVLEIEKRF
jgi:aspartyl protease family protein